MNPDPGGEDSRRLTVEDGSTAALVYQTPFTTGNGHLAWAVIVPLFRKRKGRAVLRWTGARWCR